MDWRHRAICRDVDPELFFPIGNSTDARLQTQEAKAVCRRCPVIEECLAWAQETRQDSGVLGGLSEDERRALRRRPKMDERNERERLKRAIARGALVS